MHKNRPEAKLVIYYSVSDIVLGLLLIALVGFFAVSYLQEHLSPAPEAVYQAPLNASR